MNFRCLFNTLIFCFIYTVASAQTMKQIDNAFFQRKYEVVLRDAQTMIAKEPLNPYPYGITGSVYVRESKYDSSLPFLQKAIALDNDSTWESGWAHVNLGNAYLYLGQRDKAIGELKIGLAMAATANCTQAAARILDSIGYKIPEKKYPQNYLPSWVTIEGIHMTYKFQDTTGLHNQVYKYIDKHEKAYLELFNIFEPKLPSKMVMYVWEDRDIAKKTLNQSLGFSVPKQCFSHSHRSQSLGHEITHVLSYWAWGTEPTSRSRFINEGLGVCFDLEEYDKMAAARKVVIREHIHSVLDVWKDEKDYDQPVLYPIAGAFVTYLHQNSTEADFRLVVKQQSMDKVRAIYGDRFNKLVTDFNHLMEMQ